MITLSKNGNAIRFTFVDNGHYLFNGTIDVPINSLSLITDESEMATFKKSATNDTFISALYSDFGMSKSELETWYMNNMVGSSGGSGSGGTTPEEVQQMIDESISGLAESSAVTLEISEAVSGKADSDSLATVATSGSYNDLLDKPTIPTSASQLTNDAGYITSSALDGYATLQDIPDVSNYFDGAEYDSGTTRINFYHGSTVKAYIDASAFIVDGMIDDVRIDEISGVTYLVIDFNTDSGKEDIQIPLTDIFDPSNYYTKSEVDDAISAATDDMATQTWVGEQGYLTEHQSLSAYSTTEEVNTAIEEATSGKADTSAVTAVNNVLTAHTSDADIHVTAADKTAWNAKSDFSGSYNDLTDKPTIPTVPTNVSDFNNDAVYITSDALIGYAESSAVTEEISAAVSGKVDTTTYTAYTAATDTVLSGKLDASAYTPTDLSEYWTSAQTQSAITSATNDMATQTWVNNQGFLTEHQSLSAYSTTQEVNTAIDEATSGKTDTSAFTEHTSDMGLHLTAMDRMILNNFDGKSVTSSVTSASTDSEIPTAKAVYDAVGQGGGGGGITSCEVQTMIDEATSGKADSTDVQTLSGTVTAHTADTTIHVTSSDKSTWSGKQDALVSGTNIKTINNQSLLGSGNITIQGGGSGSSTVELTQAEYDALVSGGTVDPTTYYIITDATPIDMSNYYTSAQTDSAISAATSGLQETLVSGTNIKTINNESILGSGNITIQGGGGVDSGTVQTMIDESISGKVDTSSVTTSVTSASTDSEIPTAKAVYDAVGQGGGGGGTTYSAGTNISIANDTISCTLPISVYNSCYNFGENTLTNTYDAFVYGKNNNISKLDYSYFSDYNIIGYNNSGKGSGLNIIGFNNSITHTNSSRSTIDSVIIGKNNVSSDNGKYNNTSRIIIGNNNKISGSSNVAAIGSDLICGSAYETALGRYNKSVTEDVTQTKFSGNTIFSIGNGSSSARHNAFEIRQNGDIYISSGGTDILLQDHLGGGSVSSAVTSGDTNAVSSDAVYTAMGGLKLQQITQADYDALVSGGTVDASTLYIITNVVN